MTRMRELATVIAASVGMGLCIIPVFLGTFPLFLHILSIQNEKIALIFPALLLFTTCVTALTNVLTGWLVDHYDARKVAAPGVLFFGMAIAALSLTDRAGKALFPLYAILGVAGSFCGPVVFAKAISGLPPIRRGVAFGVAITSAPMLSAATLVPITQWLIEAFGWQRAYLALGSIVVVIGVPVVLAFLREPSNDLGTTPAALRGEPSEPLRRTLLDSQFLLVTLAIAVSGLVAIGVSSHMLAIAQGIGIDQRIAVWTVSAFSIGGLIGSLLSSAFIDNAARPRILLLCFATSVCGVILMHLSLSSAMFLIGGALLGAGYYAALALLPYILSRYFGVSRLGQIFGVCAAVVSIAAAIGPLAFGIAHAQGVPFPRSLEAAILLLIVGASMVLPLRVFPRPDQV